MKDSLKCIMVLFVTFLLGVTTIRTNIASAESTPSVAFNEEGYFVSIGKTVQTKVNTYGLKGRLKYSYATDNSDIATISAKGLIKGIAEGDTIVSCVITNGEETIAKIKASIHVVIPVKKLTPANKTITMAPGTMWRAVVELSPEDATIKDVVWASSNPDVATVSYNGIITGLQKGTTNITVTAVDGSKIKDTFAVSVKDYDVVLREFECKEISYETEDGIFSINYSVKTGNVEADGGSGNTVKIIPKNAGTDTLTISIANNSTGKTKKYTYALYVEPIISEEEMKGTGIVVERSTIIIGNNILGEFGKEIQKKTNLGGDKKIIGYYIPVGTYKATNNSEYTTSVFVLKDSQPLLAKPVKEIKLKGGAYATVSVKDGECIWIVDRGVELKLERKN